MVDFLLVRISLVICLADAFRDDLGITLRVTGVFAVSTLHASRIFEEVPTQSATHHIVELLFHEFVTLFLVHLFLLLPHRALTVETNIEWSFLVAVLRK